MHPIGFFDSGLGGLSIWNVVKKYIPSESTIYLADQKNIPYGNKSEELIKTRTVECLEFLVNKGVKLIVLACNASTVSGISYYRNKFPQIPIVGVVPAIKPALALTKTNHVGVLATEKTVESEYFKKLVKDHADGKKVYSIGCTERLVESVEQGMVDADEVKLILKSYLSSFREKQVDIVVLGCTHYPFLVKTMNEINPKLQYIDSSEAVAKQVKRVIGDKIMSEKNVTDEFYTTGEKEKASKAATLLLHTSVNFQNTSI